MARTTKAELLKIESLINDFAERNDKGWCIRVEWAYGQPRTSLYRDDTHHGQFNCIRNLSPRLPIGQMKTWLWAYLRGLQMGIGKE